MLRAWLFLRPRPVPSFAEFRWPSQSRRSLPRAPRGNPQNRHRSSRAIPLRVVPGFALLAVVYSSFFLFADWQFLIKFVRLQNGPHRFARRGPHRISTRAIALAFFLVVRRNGGFRRLGGFYGRFDNALDEVAFLLLVLFVRAGIDVLDAIYQRLVFRGFLFRHLRLLVSVVPFEHGIRNLRREQADGAQRVIVSGNDPVDHVRVAI